MAKIKLYDPKTGRKSRDAIDVEDSERAEFLATVESKGMLAIDMGTGDILSNMPEKFESVGGAWEGLKTGLSAGIPLIGDEQARAREAEVERQQPGAYVGGKMVGEIGRDVAIQLGLAAARAPRGLVTAAPIAATVLQGAAEEGDTRQEILAGAAKGLGAALVGEAVGRGAGALVKAPLKALGDFVSRRLPGAIPAAPTPDIPPAATEGLREAMGERAAARGQMRASADLDKALEAEIAEMKKNRNIVTEYLASGEKQMTPAMTALNRDVNVSRARIERKLVAAGVPEERIRAIMADESSDLGLSRIIAGEDAADIAESATAEALRQLGPAAGELARPAVARATARGIAEYAVPPGSERRQVRPGAKYGTPDWTQQLQQAGVSSEVIADIEARMARLPGEVPTAEGTSPILRLQRPPVADDSTLRSAGSAARQLASGQLQLLGQYYARTQDPAVIPDMQRLGGWAAGVRK